MNLYFVNRNVNIEILAIEMWAIEATEAKGSTVVVGSNRGSCRQSI